MRVGGEPQVVDRIALRVLTKILPPELVDFVLAMCLFRQVSYEEVARLLSQGLPRGRWEVPCTSGISRARARLGPEPLKLLFDRVCSPVAEPDTAGAWYRQWRLVAVDGTAFEVPDTVVNAEFSGRAVRPQICGVPAGESGRHGGVRDTCRVPCGHGPVRVSEVALVGQPWERLEPGMLVLADRNLPAFPRWRAAVASGPNLL